MRDRASAPPARSRRREKRPSGSRERANQLTTGLETASAMRRGASRKSRALAVGRGVEHDQVERAAVEEIEQRQGGGVLLRTGQGGGDLTVDGVVEDPASHLRLGDLCLDQPTEGEGGVDARGPEHPLGHAQDPVGLGGEGGGRTTEERKAEGIGQSRRRVDRRHQGPPTSPSRKRADGGGDGGLAHAAGPRRDQDPALGRADRSAPGRPLPRCRVISPADDTGSLMRSGPAPP